MIGNRKRRRVRTVKDPGNEEFYEYIKDLVHHPYVLKMKKISPSLRNQLLSALS